MAKWLFELDLKDIWKKADHETEISWMVPRWFVDQLETRIGILITQIEAGLPTGIEKKIICEELRCLKCVLNTLKTGEGIPRPEFDQIWDVFYDLCDKKVGDGYLCWVIKCKEDHA